MPQVPPLGMARISQMNAFSGGGQKEGRRWQVARGVGCLPKTEVEVKVKAKAKAKNCRQSMTFER